MTCLQQLDNRPVASPCGGYSAFMVVRNEAKRLPYCLEYHRILGIDRFFIVDNGSDDGTRDFLLAQPDCHVFHAGESFAAANYGMAWINELVTRYGTGSWCLFVDADELFTYPHSERVTLPAFCRFLDRRNSEGVFSLMLDMYSAGPIADAAYEPGTPFLATAPYFDRDYEFGRRSALSRKGDDLVQTEVIGGPRLRMFYADYAAATPLRRTLWKGMRKLRRHPLAAAMGLGRFGSHHGLAPDLTKIPLIKARPGLTWTSNHRCTPLRLSNITGALLHFKFFADFHERARSEATRGQHWDSGAEYIRYASLIDRDPDTTLYYDSSEKFLSSTQLLELGLVRSCTELDWLAEGRSDLRRERRLCGYATAGSSLAEIMSAQSKRDVAAAATRAL